MRPTASACSPPGSWRSPGATAKSCGTRSVPWSPNVGTRWSMRSTPSSPPRRSTPRPWRWARRRPRRSVRPRSNRGARRRRRPDEDRDEDLEFWDETGVDCLEITIGGRTGYTLRCYLGEDPVFLSERRPDPDLHLARGPGELPDRGRPAARPGDTRGLAGHPQGRRRRRGRGAGRTREHLPDGRSGQEPCSRGRRRSTASSSSWPSSCSIDAALQRGDTETTDALGSASPLGNLVGATIKPDPDRQAPAPPYDDEVAAWTVLVERFSATLDWDGERG